MQRCAPAIAAVLPKGTWRLGDHALSHGIDGLLQLVFPQERSRLHVPLSMLGRKRWSLMTLTTHRGCLCPCPRDQRALLSPQGYLAHRETWNEVTVLPLPASPSPQDVLDTKGAEEEPQPLLRITALCSPSPAVAFPAMPEQSIQLCSSPPAPSSRGKAGQLGQEHPPAAGRSRCSPVPHKFIRSLGMEFMRRDSSKEKVAEITA